MVRAGASGVQLMLGAGMPLMIPIVQPNIALVTADSAAFAPTAAIAQAALHRVDSLRSKMDHDERSRAHQPRGLGRNDRPRR